MIARKGAHKGEAKEKLKEDIIKAIVRCQEKHDCNGCPYSGKSHYIEKLLNDCKRVIKGE